MLPTHPTLPAPPKARLLRRQQIRWPLAVLLLFSTALFLRIYGLEDYPIQVNYDELSNIYDGYSIAETGADRWGLKYPVILRAFGFYDNRLPLYAWLSAGSIKVFGYSIFAGRLPSVILGLGSLLLIYLTAQKTGGRVMAFLALLLACFSPWHLLFSRLGIESAILTAFFIIAALYLALQCRTKHYSVRSLIPLGLVIGLGTNTYQAGKLIFLLMALLVLADLLIHAGLAYKKVLVLGCCCLIGAAPQLYAALVMPDRFLARAYDTLVPFTFTFYYFNTLLRNFFANLSPDFLFFSFSHYNFETMGRLLPVEFPFFYLGLFYLGKVFKRPYVFPPLYCYLLLFIVVLPGALTVQNPNALRASGLVVLLPLLSAAGIVWVMKQIEKPGWRKAFLAGVTGLVIANGLYFIREYVGSEEFRNDRQYNHLVRITSRLNQYKNNYERIYLENMHDLTPLYIMHYCQIHPREFQQAPKVVVQKRFDRFIRLDKYYFLGQEEIKKQVQAFPRKSLIVSQKRHSDYKIIDSVQIYNGKPVYYFESIGSSR